MTRENEKASEQEIEDKNELLEDLILKIEYSDNQQSRIRSLEILDELNLLKTDHVDFLEDIAISDHNKQLRAIASKILINKFRDHATFLIEWSIQYENSPLILYNVIEPLSKMDHTFLRMLLINYLSEKIKDNRDKIIQNYNKELRKFFSFKSLDILSIDELKLIYLNYKFILSLEKQFKFSKNPNSRKLSFLLKEGIISELRIWGLNLEKVSDIDGIEIMTFLKILDLSGNNLREIDGLNSLKRLELLKFGDLSYNMGNQITEIKGLHSLENLRILNLSNNYIKEIKGLENLTNLKRLYLVNNSIKEIRGLDNLKNLTYLNLEKNFIDRIQGLDQLINLEILVIGHNSVSVLENIDNLSNLKEVRIHKNPLSRLKQTQFKTEIELKLYSYEIEQMNWLNSVNGIKLKSVETVKPTEYNSRYLQ